MQLLIKHQLVWMMRSWLSHLRFDHRTTKHLLQCRIANFLVLRLRGCWIYWMMTLLTNHELIWFVTPILTSFIVNGLLIRELHTTWLFDLKPNKSSRKHVTLPNGSNSYWDSSIRQISYIKEWIACWWFLIQSHICIMIYRGFGLLSLFLSWFICISGPQILENDEDW